MNFRHGADVDYDTMRHRMKERVEAERYTVVCPSCLITWDIRFWMKCPSCKAKRP